MPLLDATTFMPPLMPSGTLLALTSDPLFILDVLSRVTHVATAVVLIGGSVFMRYVLLPSAAQLPDEPHAALRQQVLARWRKFVPVGIVLFLVTGFYNYIKVAIPQHSGDGLYHALMGVKIILALVVFFIASALTGRSEALEGVRRNAKLWLALLVLLAGLIIAIAGFLKMRGPVAAEVDARHQSAAKVSSVP